MSYQVPNSFVPQSGQTIKSAETDQNNDYLTDALNDLASQVGPSGGSKTELAKVNFIYRPTYGGATAPAATEFVDRKWVEATRGARVGDIILAINPNALANDYGVEWGKLEGQQLSQTGYPDLFTICQSLSGVETGRYNQATGASPGNFVLPDARGCAISALLGVSNNMPSATTPNVANANNAGSVVGSANHTLTLAQLVAHSHGPGGSAASFATFMGGGTGSFVNGGQYSSARSTTADTGGGEAFNIIQKTFMLLMWVRFK